MVILHAKLQIYPDKKAQFLEVVRRLVEETNKEPGVISYSCYEDVIIPNTYIFYEEYQDRAALDFHAQTEHFKAWRAAGPDFIANRTPAKVMEISSITTL